MPIPMKNPTKVVMLGLLIMPFAAVINFGDAFAQPYVVEIEEGSASPGCEVENKCWEPSTMTVPVGATVIWTNKDAAGHTVTSGMPGDADSGSLFDSTKDPAGFLIKPETTWEYTFDTEGEYPYFCQVHPWMVGTVIALTEMVEEETPEEEMPEVPTLLMQTDNGTVDVVVSMDTGMVEDDHFMIDQPQDVNFEIQFLDPATGDPLEHVNYEFHIADETGAMPVHKTGLHVHNGMDTQSVSFSNTGGYVVTVEVLGTGIDRPFDTAHSGTASSTVSVVPEFPLSVMAIMAAVVGMTIAATRFKNPIKL